MFKLTICNSILVFNLKKKYVFRRFQKKKKDNTMMIYSECNPLLKCCCCPLKMEFSFDVHKPDDRSGIMVTEFSYDGYVEIK